ncbi:MAG: diacylglycerol/lipid kinase family protein [Candidatus Acidiferrales bacterium]
MLAIVNPAAGGGRARKQAPAALDKLRAAGIAIEVRETQKRGDATQLAREAYAEGWRNFIAVGGDGTAFEIVNGLFPAAIEGERPALGFLPVGRGNSLVREFSENVVEHAARSIVENHRRRCDVVRLIHPDGETYSINIVSIGFTADVATVTNRHFKHLGMFGYLLGVLTCVARLHRRAFPLRVDGESEADRRRCLFLTFNNSKFTGGNMMIAPQASTDDGLIEYVRWGPIGRIGLVRNLPTLFDGTHIHHPLASRRAVRRIEFELDGPVDLMVDGEVFTRQCTGLEVLPGALDVMA